MEVFDEGGYYDDYGEWIDTSVHTSSEVLDNIDEQGRLLDQQRLWELSQPDLPEDFNLFLSKYEQPWMSSQMDWRKGMFFVFRYIRYGKHTDEHIYLTIGSKLAFPELEFTVMLQRFDLYGCSSPAAMLGTVCEKSSSKYRRLPNFTPIRSFFVLNDHYDFTKEMHIDMAGDDYF